jgi:hypothetical protein
MRRRGRRQFNGDIESIPGDETTRCRYDDADHRIAGGGGREKHAQRIPLIEVRQPGQTVVSSKADLRDALGQ